MVPHDTAVNPAQAARWRELLEQLECWTLICGEDLPGEAWEDMGAELDALAPGLARSAPAVKAAGEAALVAHPAPAGPPPVEVVTDAPPAVAADGPSDVEDPAPADSSPPGGHEPAEEAELAGVTAASAACPDMTVPDVPGPAPSTPDTASPGAPGGGRPPRWVDIAVAVLTASGTEMSAKEILAWSLRNGPTRPVNGKTPAQTVNRDLHQAVRKGHPVLRHGSRPATFTLAG